MDRVHRQELKHDRFVEQVGHGVEYAAHHRKQTLLITIGAVAALVIGLGIYWYMQYQTGVRQDALRTAIRNQEAQVGQQPTDFLVTFTSDSEKQTAVAKAWQQVADQYPGSSEGSIAHYYLGVNAADKGNIVEAEKHFKIVAESGKDSWPSQAKLTLSSIYQSSGREAEAEKVLRSLINDPSILVSKEQATLALAKVLSKSKPAEARKLLEPLRSVPRSAVSRAAITALSEIPATR
ncbi:MAG: tetratricopeptide repeat protein [Bryobacteraceae bacterium]|nr:tetratricopeptide repeat protein [Bryobacteraceae bacterium]